MWCGQINTYESCGHNEKLTMLTTRGQMFQHIAGWKEKQQKMNGYGSKGAVRLGIYESLH